MRKNLETMKQSTRSGSRPPGGVTGKRKMYGLADPGRASKRAKRAASDGGESDETSDTDDDSEISQDELDRFWEGESSARPSALEVATAKLQSKAQEVEKLEAQLKAQKETSKGIDKKLPPLRSRVYPVQIEKNTFCSLRRNEVSCPILPLSILLRLTSTCRCTVLEEPAQKRLPRRLERTRW